MALRDDVISFDLDVVRGASPSDPVKLLLDVELSSSFNHLTSFSFLFWPRGEFQTWATATRDPETGLFKASIQLSPQATSGEYEIRVFNLVDATGKQIEVTSSQLKAAGFGSSVNLQNPFGDETAPQLTAMHLKDPIYNSNGTVTLSLDLTAVESGSGFNPTSWVELIGPGGNSFFASANLSQGSGFGSYTFTLPSSAASGLYRINTVRLSDLALNEVMTYDASKFGGQAGFSVVNPNADNNSPELQLINIVPKYDDGGRLSLQYDIRWTDDASGVASAYLRVHLPDGSLNDRWLSLNGGKSLGEVALLSTASEGVYKFSVFAVDAAGNRSTWFSSDDLIAKGFQGSLTVAAELPPVMDLKKAAVSGKGFADHLTASATDGDGSLLEGNGGNDTLQGRRFNDMLSGGRDDDLLTGGLGSDQFRFFGSDITGSSDRDVVSDLNFAEGDTLVFGGFAAGTFFKANGVNGFSGGTAAILDSWNDLRAADVASDKVTVSRASPGGNELLLQITNADGNIQNIVINGGWSQYVAALGFDPGS